MQNFHRQGKILTWRNTTGANVKGGQLLIIGDIVGVATLDITKDAIGAVAPQGVFRLPKDAAAIAVGQRVYVDGSGKITATVGSNPAGVAWADALAAETVAMIKINV